MQQYLQNIDRIKKREQLTKMRDKRRAGRVLFSISAILSRFCRTLATSCNFYDVSRCLIMFRKFDEFRCRGREDPFPHAPTLRHPPSHALLFSIVEPKARKLLLRKYAVQTENVNKITSPSDDPRNFGPTPEISGRLA